MNVQLYEKLKRQYETQRRLGHESVETEYTKNLEALERVWASIHGKQTAASETTANQAVSQETSTPRTRTQGVTKAVEETVHLFEGDFSPDDVMEKRADLGRQAVTDSLWRLEKKGVVEIVVQGKGRRKGVYRVKRRTESDTSQPLINEAAKEDKELTM